MRWINGVGFVSAVILAGACKVYSTDDSVGFPAENQVDAGVVASQDGSTDDGSSEHPIADDGIALQISSTEQRIVQGTSLQIPVRVVRGKDAKEPVQIIVKDLRTGLSADPCAVTGNEAVLTITAVADVAQGAAVATVEASLGDQHVVAPLNLFVRGPSGSLDTTFAKNGIYEEPAAGSTAFKLVAGSNESMLITYRCTLGTCIRRLSVDGAVDTNFGEGGIGSIGLYTARDTTSAVFASPGTSGELFLGTNAPPPYAGTNLGRLNSNGNSDVGFKGGVVGLLSTTLYSLTADGDELLVASNVAGRTNISLERYTKDGVPDSAFGTVKPFVVDASYREEVVGMTVRSSGNIALLAMRSIGDATHSVYVGLCELNRANGSPNTSFGNGGRIAIYVPGPQMAYVAPRTVTWSKSGSVVGALYSADQYWLFSFLKNGLRNPNFGDGNGLVGPIDRGGMQPMAMAEASDGKLWLLSFPRVEAKSAGLEGRLTRLMPTGEIDSSFGNNGAVNLPASAGKDYFDIVVQADGRIVVSMTRTSSYYMDTDRFVIARYWD